MRILAFIQVLLIFSFSGNVSAQTDTLVDSSITMETDTGLSEQKNDSTVLNESTSQLSGEEKSPQIDTIDAIMLTVNKFKRFQAALERSISKARVQGYGGGVIIQPMILGLRTEPIYKLVSHDSQLRQFVFQDLTNHSYSPLLVNGAWLYGGVGNGVRVGFGGWTGECFFGSDVTPSDSLMTLKIRTGFGGLMVEKVFVHKKLNIITGGVFGGGLMKVTKSYQDADVFGGVAWNEDLDNEAEAKARQVGLELRAGMTISLLSWWHLGMDLNSHFLLSVNGFGGSVNSFVTVNPGLRLRVVLGNLG
ncbi:MAG: hypothetical protein GX267_07025 [Fibrobacter sp.]|jgi:hypothetical protein|nr:hypothetical protein [Fibrobacter sp.]